MSQVAQALKGFVKDMQPEWLLLAKVTGVDTATQTCTCVDHDGNTYLDVRIQPQAGSSTAAGFYLLPKRNSWVVIGSLQGKDEHVVLMVSEIDKLEAKPGVTHLILKNEGLVLKNASNNLADAMTELINELAGLTVVTPAGTGTLDPGVITNLNLIKTKFQSLLKSS